MTTRVKATYEIRVDLNGDRTFTDTDGDISAFVREIAECTHGMRKPGDRIGQSARLRLVLDNTAGLFSPEGASALSGFVKGRPIRVRMTYNATTVDLYNGRIDDIRPQTGTRGKRETEVVCEGFLTQLSRMEAYLGIQQDKTYDEILQALFDMLMAYPAPLSGWYLGITGQSELGETTTLGGSDSYSDLEAGVNTFPYAGDNWQDGISVFRAITDVIMAEGGWLFEDVDGFIHGWNRHHLVLDMTNAVDATLTGANLNEAEYSYGGMVMNAVEVTFSPRGVGTATTDLVGSVTNSIKVAAGQEVEVIVRYDDGSGNRISALSIVQPQRIVDYTVKQHENGRGLDLTDKVPCKAEAYSDKAILKFTNTGLVDGFVMAGATLRGQKLTDFGQRVVRAIDQESITAYGRYSNQIHLPLLSDEVYASDLARWIVDAYKDPSGTLKSIMFYAEDGATLMAQARDRRIGDRVQVSELQTGADSEYFIMGVRRTIKAHRHRVTWMLEPAPSQMYWVLGVSGFSELGETTVLGL